MEEGHRPLCCEGSCCLSAGAQVYSGQNPGGPDRLPSQLPPPFGLLATPQEKPSTPSAATPPPARCKAPPQQLFLQDPRKPAQNQVKSLVQLPWRHIRPAHLCVLQTRLELVRLSQASPVGAASTPGPPSLWASSSDPEGHLSPETGLCLASPGGSPRRAFSSDHSPSPLRVRVDFRWPGRKPVLPSFRDIPRNVTQNPCLPRPPP